MSRGTTLVVATKILHWHHPNLTGHTHTFYIYIQVKGGGYSHESEGSHQNSDIKQTKMSGGSRISQSGGRQPWRGR